MYSLYDWYLWSGCSFNQNWLGRKGLQGHGIWEKADKVW